MKPAASLEAAVTPAKAGTQFFGIVMNKLDPGFRRDDG